MRVTLTDVVGVHAPSKTMSAPTLIANKLYCKVDHMAWNKVV